MITLHIRKCCYALVINFMLSASSLMAQQYLSLPELVDSATKNIPLSKQRQALVNSSLASVSDVRHSFLPQARFSQQINIGSNNSMVGTYFTFGITPSTSAGEREAPELVQAVQKAREKFAKSQAEFVIDKER